jgi:hypothetical protein
MLRLQYILPEKFEQVKEGFDTGITALALSMTGVDKTWIQVPGWDISMHLRFWEAGAVLEIRKDPELVYYNSFVSICFDTSFDEEAIRLVTKGYQLHTLGIPRQPGSA